MKMQLNGEIVDMTPYSLAYGNDLLDGVLLDMPDNYIFLSDHIESHRDVMEDIAELEHFDLTGCDIDFDQAPHSWVVMSVARTVVASAEKVCRDGIL